jgi:predicted 3-demethylubiquinone-9 3-methyltransferase (glyoxalase superfamily)
MSAPAKVATCLWFDRQAEEAAEFYTSLIPGSKICSVSRFGEGAPMPAGLALMVVFDLGGAPYMALNGGPKFRHSEAASIVVHCDTQEEIDRLWASLIRYGGQECRCGWLKDRYGLSWQIVPSKIGQWMNSPDRSAAGRVMSEIMQMVKPDIAAMERAFAGA